MRESETRARGKHKGTGFRRIPFIKSKGSPFLTYHESGQSHCFPAFTGEYLSKKNHSCTVLLCRAELPPFSWVGGSQTPCVTCCPEQALNPSSRESSSPHSHHGVQARGQLQQGGAGSWAKSLIHLLLLNKKNTSPVWNRSQSIALLSKSAQQFQLNSISQEWIHPLEHLSNPLDYSLNLSVFQIIYWNFPPCTIPDLTYPTEHSETRGRAGAAPLGLSILCFCAALQVLAAPHQPFRICTFPDNSLKVHFLCSCRSQNQRFASVNGVFFHLRFQEKQLSDGFWNLQQI